MADVIARYTLFAYGAGECADVGQFDSEAAAESVVPAAGVDDTAIYVLFAEKRVEFEGGWDLDPANPVAVYLNGEKWRCVRDGNEK